MYTKYIGKNHDISTQKAIQTVSKLLTDGQKAPDFTAKDVYGNTIDLDAFTGKYVLVAFMRYSGCPYCNLAVHRLSVEYAMLQQHKCDVVAFMQSAPNDILENIYQRHKLKPPFPIIADKTKKFYDLYHIRSSKRAFFTSQLRTIPYWVESVGKHEFRQGKLNGDHFLVPAMFLVRTKDHKIVKARYGTSYYDYEAFTDLYEVLNFGDPV